ncbi:ribonuclease D [Agaribacter flavus]|uniref:Ribonuclease D n=1 Tax=Agaribacter flavus TaxID=1902781 RepID=A0ABV7FN29_9ALTE
MRLDFDCLHENFVYIDSDPALASLCQRCQSLDYIMLDTEFVRTKTLYPLLGLVQIFDGEKIYLLDPKSVKNLSPLADLLTDKTVMKVIHSCSEDLDALKHNVGAYPTPLFDTQIAAGFLNIGNSIGYANLVEKICHVSLDKTESRTDWLARPLRKEQLRYAAADVSYLYIVFENLFEQAKQNNLIDAILSESEGMIKKKQCAIPNDDAYMNVGNNWKLNGKQLLALKLLAQWRLEKAQESNTSINFIMRENCMFEIAMRLPQSPNALSRIHGITPKQLRVYGQLILDMIAQLETAEEHTYPHRIERLIEFPKYKKAVSELKKTITDVSSSTGIPEPMIASKKQINDLLKWCWFANCDFEKRGIKPDLLMGWRRTLLLDKIRPIFDSNEGEFNALRSL